MEGSIRGLVITLKRGLAGSREQHRAILSSLGLFRRQQVVIQPNTAIIRGALDKVRRRDRHPERDVPPAPPCSPPIAAGRGHTSPVHAC